MLFTVIITSARQPDAAMGTDAGQVLPGGTSAGGTSAGGTSATGTSATTGATAGDLGNLSIGYTFLQKMEERLHCPSAYLVGTTLTNSSDRHVLRLKINCLLTSGAGADGTGTWESHSGIGAIAVPVGSEIGPDSSTPTVTSGTITLPDNVTTVNCAITEKFTLLPSGVTWTAWVQMGSASTLNSGTLNYYIHYMTSYVHKNLMGVVDNSSFTYAWQLISLPIDKIPLEGISTDSRKVYGKANLDGELPGDPNADPSTNNFQPWIFRGGHFVGNLPYSSAKDLSGTSRTQLRLTTMTDNTNYIAGCLSCFASGTRGSNSPGTIGLFRPLSTDSHLNQGLTTIWDTKWDVTPGGTQSGPGDFNKAPYYTVTPNTTTPGTMAADQMNYVNWQMPPTSLIWQTAYGGDGNPLHKDMWQYFDLCQTNESATAWQYFGSTWLEGVTGQMFPFTDSKPRIWKIRG